MSEGPTKPGQRCRVIMTRSKFNGEGNGPNFGKIVYTKHLHGMRAGLPEASEAVWRCETRDGSVLVTYHGAASTEADFLAGWLESIPEPEKELPRVTAKELEE